MKTTNRLLTVLALLAVLALAGCRPTSELRVGELQTESKSIESGDARSVSVKIKMGAGDLKVNGGAEKLLGADFTYNVAELKPEVKFTGGTLVIWEPGNKGRIDWRGIKDFRNEWSLRFNNILPMDLSVEMGAGNSTIDLSGDWPEDLQVAIEAGAGDITVRLPKDVGVRVDVERGPTMINAWGMTQDGNTYTNAAYDVSDVTMQIDLKTGIGEINLEVVE